MGARGVPVFILVCVVRNGLIDGQGNDKAVGPNVNQG